MSFPDNSFDAVYAIEATVHAPSLEGIYSEIFRVLKPGGVFGVYEWLMTDKYDNTNPAHREIRLGIEQGDGISNMEKIDVALAAVKAAGFELELNEDLADRVDPMPWYWPLSGNFRYLQSVFDIFTIWRLTKMGRGTVHAFVGLLEKVCFLFFHTPTMLTSRRLASPQAALRRLQTVWRSQQMPLLPEESRNSSLQCISWLQGSHSRPSHNLHSASLVAVLFLGFACSCSPNCIDRRFFEMLDIMGDNVYAPARRLHIVSSSAELNPVGIEYVKMLEHRGFYRHKINEMHNSDPNIQLRNPEYNQIIPRTFKRWSSKNGRLRLASIAPEILRERESLGPPQQQRLSSTTEKLSVSTSTFR